MADVGMSRKTKALRLGIIRKLMEVLYYLVQNGRGTNLGCNEVVELGKPLHGKSLLLEVDVLHKAWNSAAVN